MTFGRRLAIVVVLTALSGGCRTAPRSFLGVANPAAIQRARALSLGRGLPESLVVPQLVERLNDPDVVVRMSANEELKQGTGQDFGFVAWADAPERKRAVGRWDAWWKERQAALANSRLK